MRYRVAIALTLAGQPVGSHEMTVEAADPDRAIEDALRAVSDSYSELHTFRVETVRRVHEDEIAADDRGAR